ncbi:MAG: hypothetical protein K2N54_08390, partial [Helicobacter sp.]|nr:hypothetical protein [Helicobacter sp.]
FASLNMTRFHVSLRASVTSVAINKQRILESIRDSMPFDCFAHARNDKAESSTIPKHAIIIPNPKKD